MNCGVEQIVFALQPRHAPVFPFYFPLTLKRAERVPEFTFLKCWHSEEIIRIHALKNTPVQQSNEINFPLIHTVPLQNLQKQRNGGCFLLIHYVSEMLNFKQCILY